MTIPVKTMILAFCFIVSAAAMAEPSVQVFSRNMPVDCQYVFAVDSDIYFEFTGVSAPVVTLTVSYKEEYSGTWSAPTAVKVYPVPGRPQAYFGISSFRSMSTNPKHLYRKVAFFVANPRGMAQTPFYAEFARQFGEKCYPTPAATPFLPRPVLTKEP